MGANSDYCPIDASMSITVGGEFRVLAQQADMKFVTMSKTSWRKSVRSHCDVAGSRDGDVLGKA
jgi:hypothetical protein